MEDIIRAMHERWPDFPLITDLEENVEPLPGPLVQNVGMNNGGFKALCIKRKESVVVPLLFFVPDQSASLSIMDGFSAIMCYGTGLPYAFVVPSLSRNAFLDTLCKEFDLHLEKHRKGDIELQLDREYDAVIEMKEGWAVLDFELVKFNGLKVCRMWTMYLINKKDFIETTEFEREGFLHSFGLEEE